MGADTDLLSKAEQQEVVAAVKQAESQTSGEIRVYIEKRCKGDALHRAAFVFKQLNVHETALRNGILFYLAETDRKFAILGDAGINKIVPKDFWANIKHTMALHFGKGEFTSGLSKGIEMAGEALKQYFPHQKDDKNELPDDIVFGE